MIANPLTDKFIDFNSRVQAAHRLALLSDELFKVRNLVYLVVYIYLLYWTPFFFNGISLKEKRTTKKEGD